MKIHYVDTVRPIPHTSEHRMHCGVKACDLDPRTENATHLIERVTCERCLIELAGGQV